MWRRKEMTAPCALCSSGRQRSRLCPGRSRAGKKNRLLVRFSRYRNQLPPGACQNQSQSRSRTRIVKQKQSRNQSRCAGKWKRAARSRLPAGKNIKKSPLRRRKTLRSCLSRMNRIMMTSRRWILMNLLSMHANMPATLTAVFQERACWPSMSGLKLWRKTAYPLQR